MLVPERGLLHVVRVGRPLVEVVTSQVVARLPVTKGQVLGQVKVYSHGELLGSRRLVATRTVRRPGLVGRVRWYAGRTLHHLGGFL